MSLGQTDAGVEVRAVTGRFATVDVLRGLAILLVVLHHTFLRLLFNGYPMQKRMPRELAHLLFFNGQNGVTVFFAVSGFLITLTSLRRFGSLAEMRAKVFYRIRFARIAPLLLLIVGLLTALALGHVSGFTFSSKMAPLWRAVVSALTFHLNWLEAKYGYLPANWDVLWSLSVEEMFYLFFPLVCLLTLRAKRGVGVLVALLVVFVAMGPFARSIWTTNEIWAEKAYLGGMDGIALGCLTALLVDRLSGRSWAGRRGWWLVGLQAVGAGWMLLNALGPKWFYKMIPGKLDFYGTLLALAACLVILGSVLRESRGAWWTAALRWYGRHSYEIYLTHEFVVVWGVALFLRLHPNVGEAKVAVGQLPLGKMAEWFVGVVAVTVPLGWAVARGFSEPMNRWLRGGRQVGRG